MQISAASSDTLTFDYIIIMGTVDKKTILPNNLVEGLLDHWHIYPILVIWKNLKEIEMLEAKYGFVRVLISTVYEKCIQIYVLVFFVIKFKDIQQSHT